VSKSGIKHKIRGDVRQKLCDILTSVSVTLTPYTDDRLNKVTTKLDDFTDMMKERVPGSISPNFAEYNAWKSGTYKKYVAEMKFHKKNIPVSSNLRSYEKAFCAIRCAVKKRIDKFCWGANSILKKNEALAKNITKQLLILSETEAAFFRKQINRTRVQ
jgi:hypothetical protein